VCKVNNVIKLKYVVLLHTNAKLQGRGKMDNKQIKVGMIGLGVVGSGTYKIMRENADIIKYQVGKEVVIEKILVRDISKTRAVEVPKDILTTNPDEIINNPDIDIVVEVIGGEQPAYDYINTAIKNGKHVVTANKELIAKRGSAILASADEKGVAVGFEASVCGGIPIIRAFKSSLSANRINKIMGIVNGTTNYILTKMTREGLEYEQALKEAQEKGYAESNPTADVEGYDAMYKMAILASIGFVSRVDIGNISREGISKISKSDIQYAKELGWVIKLLGIAKEVNGRIEVRVSPTMLSADHPLALVNDVNNAVFVRGDAVGEVMLYGPGAGQMPTGSSIVSDIIDIGRNINMGSSMRRNCTCFLNTPMADENDIESSFYIRLNVLNRPGVLSKIAGVFGENGVSLESVLQKKTEGDWAEIVWITSNVKEYRFLKAVQDIENLDVVNNVYSIIRVE